MSNRTMTGILLALIASVFAISPVLSQQFYTNTYGNPYGNPYGLPYNNPYNNQYRAPSYNNYAYRGYAPYQEYGYRRNKTHTVRNVAIGAGIGALIGLMASRHGHKYD